MLHLHRPIDLSGAFSRAANPLRWLGQLRWYREQQRLVRNGWYDPSARSNSAAVFIGGCLRSGTTLVREILNRHPRFGCSLETGMLAPPFEVSRIASYYQLDESEIRRATEKTGNVVDFSDNFYRNHIIENSSQRWVDKAAGYVRVIGRLLTWYPNGRFIHVLRDGRDVSCSLRNHPREVLDAGKIVRRQIHRQILECAGIWLAEVSLGRAYEDHPRTIEVRYEDLVAAPEAEMRRICMFLGEDFVPAILEADDEALIGAPPARFLTNENAAGPISRASVGRWRHELSHDERVDFDNIAGELLIAVGYADDHDWVTSSEAEGSG
jgi:protein-tyrosine sulfotransferase